MTDRTKWLLVGSGVATAIVLWFLRDDVSDSFLKAWDGITNVFSKTKLIDGTVTLDGKPADPQALADADGVDLDTYALARMVQSEAGILNDSGKLGVAFAALTWSRNSGKSISDILLKARGDANGFFGEQSQGRYAATSRDPGQDAYDAAIAAIGGRVPDPTGGADQWDSPWSYSEPSKTDSVAASRMAAGKVKVVLSDVPERKLRFWRKA